jgi:hypothetical protein
MRLPEAKDVEATLPEHHGITRAAIESELALAPAALELMTATFIAKQTIEENLFLWNRPEQLRHFPVRDVSTRGLPIHHDAATGTLLPELEPSNYLVTYTVGHDRNNVPAIYAKTVLHLVRHRLLRTEEDQEEAIAAIGIIRLNVMRLRKAREREQTYRKGPG